MLKITTPAFAHEAEIPMRYTQEAENLSPELVFSGVPANARSLVLLSDDPDAPDPAAPKRIWLHWLVVNIPTEDRRFCRRHPRLSARLPCRRQRQRRTRLVRSAAAHRTPPLFLQALRFGYGA